MTCFIVLDPIRKKILILKKDGSSFSSQPNSLFHCMNFCLKFFANGSIGVQCKAVMGPYVSVSVPEVVLESYVYHTVELGTMWWVVLTAAHFFVT